MEKTKEHLFVKLEMWVREDEEGQPCSIRYNYNMPDIKNEMIADLYKAFIETFCNEVAKLEGADKVLNSLPEVKDE